MLLRFGRQVDTKPIRPGGDLPGTGRKLPAPAVGNYIAKYDARPSTPPASLDRNAYVVAAYLA
jgi:hypothetical protein